jgi:hypothetical protein
MIVELQRDPHLYPDGNIVEVMRPRRFLASTTLTCFLLSLDSGHELADRLPNWTAFLSAELATRQW